MSLTLHIGNIWRMIVVFFSSILPFCESKGSILIANMFHLRLVPSGIVSSAGAFVPVPFILKGGRFGVPEKTEDDIKTGKRAFFKKIVQQYGWIALLAITAIPCTGVGTWLGAIIARVAGLDKKKAAIAIFIGNCIATFLLVAVIAGVKILF